MGTTKALDYGHILDDLPIGLRGRLLILSAARYRCGMPTMRRWLQRIRSLAACRLCRRWRVVFLARIMLGIMPGVLTDGGKRCLFGAFVASRLRSAPQFDDQLCRCAVAVSEGGVGGNILKADLTLHSSLGMLLHAPAGL